ncbi:hypothetical protein NR798_25375 [Archangium gephyra]|uniref:hypothetical protein n=1 Tax=Archangium gephyra TaxID=48 RepID=UPI0035D4CF37
MSLLRWCRPLLSAALVLVGCKSNPAAAADAGTAAPSKAPTQAPAPVPASGSALSYFKPVGPQKCEWIRQPLPAGAPTPVFTFDATCDRSEVFWSPNGKAGLVFTSEGTPPRLWLVDFAAKTGKPLDLKGVPGGGAGKKGPGKPIIQRVGFDAQGSPVVLVALLYTNRELTKGKGKEKFITFENQRYPVPPGEGTPGLALAYRLEGADWKRSETKASSFESDNAPGLDALDASRSLYDPAPALSEELPGQKASESAARMLDTAAAQTRPGQWMALPTPGGTLLYRATEEDSDESLFVSAPVRWEQDGKLAELEGLTAKPGDRLGFQLHGGLLAITVLSDGTTRSAHVYDTRTKKNLVSARDAESVTFWPEPSKP